MNELDIYDVNLKYIRDLHNADSNVMSQSPQINKETRRYIGIILMINGQPYCIPFSSGNKEKFQNKKSNIDLLKIPDEEHKTSTGAFKTLAVLNINNMIPVSKSVIAKVDLHILLHLKERTHNSVFISYMDLYMKDWRAVRKELNDLRLDYYNMVE